MDNKDTLNDFGILFQWKIISSLLADKLFMKQIMDILKPEYFIDESIQYILKIINDYFIKYDNMPTLDVFKAELKKESDQLFKESVVDGLKKIYSYADSTDLPYVKDKTLDFCKNQELKKAILDSVDHLENQDYNLIKQKIDKAMTAGAELNVGHDYIKDIEERYKVSVRDTIPTPWEVINEIMDGGLGKGETASVLASAGAGKSWILSAIGMNALKLGYDVIHYTLELQEEVIGLRYDALLTGLAVGNLKFHQKDVNDHILKLEGGGNLIIKYYPPMSASYMTLSAHLEKCMIKDIKPKLVIIDYADNMISIMKHEKDYQRFQNVYMELASLAGKYELPVWTASQTNRSSIEKDVIGAEDIAGSYGKIMESFFNMSFSRKTEDKQLGTARIHIIKNRFGPDGLTFSAKFNGENGNIQIFDDNTIEGKTLKKGMEGDNQLKNIALRKYTALKDTADHKSDLM